MIKDKLNYAENYYGISDNLKTGFQWLRTTDLKSIQDGRYNISDEIYANVQTYTTKDDAPYEAHRKYIDIQYMIDGSEFVGVTDYKNCKSQEEYNNEKDIEFLKLNGEENLHTLKTGEFLVFFPNDAHKPALECEQKKTVKKVIVKVVI